MRRRGFLGVLVSIPIVGAAADDFSLELSIIDAADTSGKLMASTPSTGG